MTLPDTPHEHKHTTRTLDALLCATPCYQAAVARLQAEADATDAEENARMLAAERSDDAPVPEWSDAPVPPDDPKADPYLHYNGATLRYKDFPIQPEAIPDLLPLGLTVIASPPKIGKSRWVLNIACAIACGGTALSRFAVKQGDVLYLALEDSPKRMQTRLLLMHGDYDQWPEILPDFVHRAKYVGAGLDEYLEGWLAQHKNARLIAIDTLEKIRPARQRGQDSYAEDYRITARLQQLALKSGIAILVVHHTKKGPEEDFLSAVSGTHGVTGAADTVMVLKRRRGAAEGTLSVTGRDIEERDLAMKQTDGDWLCLGDATEVNRSETRKKILDAVAQHPLTPAEIATATGMKAGAVRQRLMKMLDQGEVTKSQDKYALPTNTP